MARLDQRGFDNQRSDSLDARAAARFLGVKLTTLYAYASRGLVRRESGAKGRALRYLRSDLERLKKRGEARAGHGPVAAGALRWGEPVLATAISSIGEDGPSYRGQSAIALAEAGHHFERVAELLWSGELPAKATWTGDEAAALVRRLRSSIPLGQAPLATLLAAVPRLALLDTDRFDAPPEAEWARARTLSRAMALVVGWSLGGDDAAAASVAETMAEAVSLALGVSPKRAREPINRVLILTADHELNASTFAARVVASTGADLYSCVTGALSALTGPRHGALSDRVESLLDEVGEPSRARDVIALRTSRGESIPGFGHPLYPAGDPRVPPLLEMAKAVAPRTSGRSGLELCLSVVTAMERSRRAPPNLDLGLVAVVRALGLPRGAAAALFALGRTAGWVAHALEQREAGYLLRPRAQYVGK